MDDTLTSQGTIGGTRSTVPPQKKAELPAPLLYVLWGLTVLAWSSVCVFANGQL